VTAVQRSLKTGKASKPRARAATPKNAVSWILLEAALALITDAYQNSELAQQKLCKAFVESQVRTRAACADGGWISEPGQGQGQWKEYEHNLQLSDLWRREHFAPGWTPCSGKLRILWQGSRATLQPEDSSPVTVTFYRIEVAREDVSKLLPEGYEPRIPPALPATSSTAEPHPGGAPREYSREQILIEAAAYIVVNNLPETQTKLRDEIALILGNRSPGDTLLGEILRPLYKRIAEVLAANR